MRSLRDGAPLRRRGLLLAFTSLTLASACAGTTPAPGSPQPALCRIDTTVSSSVAPRDRTFPAQYWFVLLLRGYQSSGVIARPAIDCSGLPARLETDGCEGEPQLALEAPTAVTAHDLVIATVSDTQRLVWVITDRLSNGEAQGPVALAEIVPTGIVVRALGLLRSFPDHPTLRLERLGTGTVLVAEGERCTDPRQPETCDRAIRIVPRIDDRFVPKPVLGDGGICLERAVLDVRGTGATSKKKGARYQVESVVAFKPDFATIREQLVLSGDGAAPADSSFVRRVQADRQITLRGASLVATAPSLLARWRAQSAAGAPR